MVIPGCGDGNAGRIPTFRVTGKVTHQQQPVEGATVLFAPIGEGKAATGITDAKGTYKLQTFQAGDGAVPGRYKVTISKYDMSTANPDLEDDLAMEMREDTDQIVGPTALLPEKFAEVSSTPFEHEVADNHKNQFDFDLVD